jgi:hypothetical protein
VPQLFGQPVFPIQEKDCRQAFQLLFGQPCPMGFYSFPTAIDIHNANLSLFPIK